jgi:NADH-quinone oxidoreductase E subunit
MKTDTDNWKEVEAASMSVLTPDIVKYIEECRKGPEPESRLIGVLHKVQEHFGYLGIEQMDAVAQLLQVPSSRVTGVATFYHFFRMQQRGKYVINVCQGTACYVKGSDRLAVRLKQELGIEFGETTKDGVFTLEEARCLGTCGLAPVVMIGEEIYGQVTPDQIPALLEKYMEKK